MGAMQYGIALSDSQLDMYQTYCEFLLETNKITNLTAITNPDEVVSKHFCDSICARLAVDFMEVRSLVDIGSGPGLPGFALKIAFPHLKLVAIESIGKKARFLQDLTVLLKLESTKVINDRAENLIKIYPEFIGSFDVATARAVGNIAMLLDYAKPFLKKGGKLLLWKSRDEVAQLPSMQKQIRHAGFDIEKTYPYKIPLWELERFLVSLARL
jgi:16S rRNA (guanine(527)-N(7))-methyltransferase RsmG